MVFERAPHQMNAVGDERGGERIAGEAAVGLAVEEERDGLGAIDAPALGRAELARHAGRRNRSHESAISASFVEPPCNARTPRWETGFCTGAREKRDGGPSPAALIRKRANTRSAVVNQRAVSRDILDRLDRRYPAT